MTKQQIAILVVLGLAVVCVLGIGGYIFASEERAYQALQAFTSLVPQIATEPPTTAPAPADTPVPQIATEPPTTPIPPTSTPTPVPLLSATPDIAEPSTVAVTFTGTYPAPNLVGPVDGDVFRGDETILLVWDTPTPLSEDEWYEVQLWGEEEVPYRVVQWVKEGTWKVESSYYPGHYQWRILIVRGQEKGRKEELSPPSQTRKFGWLRPSVPVSTAAPTSPPVIGTTVDLTVYLRGTKNAQGFDTFSGDYVDAGAIYEEGRTVYGEVAVRIGDTVYHFDEDPEPVGVKQLPAPYRLEVEFSKPLVAATGDMQPGFNDQKAQFWVGELDCNSAAPKEEPYTIKMTLYAGGEVQKQTTISFLVIDAPLCGFSPETGRIWQPPPTYAPPPCDFTVYLRGTNNAEGFAAFCGEHVDAGWIYTEGAYFYGEIAVRIGDNEYHYYEQDCCPPPRRPDDHSPFRVEFKFSDSLLAATKGVQPQFNGSNLRFWAGILDCNSATPKPYRIEATLYKDEKIRKRTEITFLVVDDPLCDQP